MPSIEESPCPKCSAPPGTLRLTEQLVADPIGSHALAGVQMKVNARSRPVLTCISCSMSLVGEFDRDGVHVVFDAPATQDR